MNLSDEFGSLPSASTVLLLTCRAFAIAFESDSSLMGYSETKCHRVDLIVAIVMSIPMYVATEYSSDYGRLEVGGAKFMGSAA